MAPRDPTYENGVAVDSDEATKLTSDGKTEAVEAMDTPSTVQNKFNTFHWELNVYSVILLSALYYATPVSHRLFWHVIFGLVAVDAARYYGAKGRSPGVPYTFPFVTVVAMIAHPVRFWNEMGRIAMASSSGICSNNLVGNFMLFVTDPVKCKQIFTGEGVFQLYAHPNAYWLFGAKNLIYLPTDVHKKARAILTPALFSEDALAQYATAQETVVRRFLKQYEGKVTEAMVAFRSMAAASSQEAFMGPYLTDELREMLEANILVFTMGFLSFPIPYIGGLRKAIQAKNRIEAAIREIVPQSRAYVVEKKGSPRCLLEHWHVQILAAAKELQCDPADVPNCTDDDIALCVLDFLFAAQDATNSGLTYALDAFEAHPHVLDRLHKEVTSVCGSKKSVAAALGDRSLVYTAKTANQLLHYKPPVPMVPHLTLKDAVVDGLTVRKGTVVIPSVIYAARVTGAALAFDPESEDADAHFVKTFTFGAGQHKCPGRKYAESLLAVFCGVLAEGYTIERVAKVRPGADEFIYFPTCFPKDSKFLLKARA
jgi:cytochrome P450